MFRPAALLSMLLCSMNVGCGPGASAGETCMVDEDCASRFCRADRTCGPQDVDGGATDATLDAPPSGVCTPNHDGSITQAELPLTAGKMARFRVATDATFDTAGSPDGGGARRWDLTGALANDTDQTLTLSAPAGTWWAPSFPTASYYATLSASSELLGVFHIDANGLTLLGVVSPSAGSARTELEYDPPAKILELPFAEGDTWTSTSTVSGVASGVAAAYTEVYASTVDKVGTMTTPYGEFPVLRVATNLDRTSFGAPIASTRSFAWMSECFGSVANVSSQDFESSAEFNDPAEVRRIAP